MSQDFDDISVKVLLDGTHSFTFRCNARFADNLAVVVYRPNEKATPLSDGILVSIAFVPKHFRLKSLAELASERTVIIEGRAASDLNANAQRPPSRAS